MSAAGNLTPADHARALGRIGIDRRRAKIRATAREIARAAGVPLPDALKESSN